MIPSLSKYGFKIDARAPQAEVTEKTRTRLVLEKIKKDNDLSDAVIVPAYTYYHLRSDSLSMTITFMPDLGLDLLIISTGDMTSSFKVTSLVDSDAFSDIKAVISMIKLMRANDHTAFGIKFRRVKDSFIFTSKLINIELRLHMTYVEFNMKFSIFSSTHYFNRVEISAEDSASFSSLLKRLFEENKSVKVLIKKTMKRLESMQQTRHVLDQLREGKKLLKGLT
jgi:hypothetical protein